MLLVVSHRFIHGPGSGPGPTRRKRLRSTAKVDGGVDSLAAHYRSRRIAIRKSSRAFGIRDALASWSICSLRIEHLGWTGWTYICSRRRSFNFNHRLNLTFALRESKRVLNLAYLKLQRVAIQFLSVLRSTSSKS